MVVKIVTRGSLSSYFDIVMMMMMILSENRHYNIRRLLCSLEDGNE